MANLRYIKQPNKSIFPGSKYRFYNVCTCIIFYLYHDSDNHHISALSRSCLLFISIYLSIYLYISFLISKSKCAMPVHSIDMGSIGASATN